jgi:hypothetical protein
MALEYVTLPGAGEKVAADALAGGELVQYVKLVSGAANSEVPIAAGGGTEANGLRVAPGVVTMTTLATTKSSSGDNAVVTTPGSGYRLVVSSFVIQNDASGAHDYQRLAVPGSEQRRWTRQGLRRRS